MAYMMGRNIDLGQGRLTADNKICGECKWHRQDDYHKSDYVCVNADSDYCTEYTDYTDSCREWEQRGVE